MIALAAALLALAACETPVVGDEAATGGSGGGGSVVGDDPVTCELWPTVTPPEDFDAVCDPTGLGADLLGDEATMFGLINADRAEHAAEANYAAPLGYDCVVAQVARLHSYEMCKAGELEHVLDGQDHGDRLAESLGWQLGDEYVASAENLSWFPDLVEAEDDFVENEPPCDPVAGGHRLNILDRDLRFVGVGQCHCVGDPWGNFYLTQLFVTYEASHLSRGNPYCGW